jgi:hypothetical protein
VWALVGKNYLVRYADAWQRDTEEAPPEQRPGPGHVALGGRDFPETPELVRGPHR